MLRVRVQPVYEQPSSLLPAGHRCLFQSQRVMRSVFMFRIGLRIFEIIIAVIIIQDLEFNCYYSSYYSHSGFSYPVSLSLAGRGQLLLPRWGLAAGNAAVQRGDQCCPLRSGWSPRHSIRVTGVPLCQQGCCLLPSGEAIHDFYSYLVGIEWPLHRLFLTSFLCLLQFPGRRTVQKLLISCALV